MHRSKLSTFVIDCRVDDLDAATRFWSEALGRPIEPPSPDNPKYRGLRMRADEPAAEAGVVDAHAPVPRVGVRHAPAERVARRRGVAHQGRALGAQPARPGAAGPRGAAGQPRTAGWIPPTDPNTSGKRSPAPSEMRPPIDTPSMPVPTRVCARPGYAARTCASMGPASHSS